MGIPRLGVETTASSNAILTKIAVSVNEFASSTTGASPSSKVLTTSFAMALSSSRVGPSCPMDCHLGSKADLSTSSLNCCFGIRN